MSSVDADLRSPWELLPATASAPLALQRRYSFHLSIKALRTSAVAVLGRLDAPPSKTRAALPPGLAFESPDREGMLVITDGPPHAWAPSRKLPAGFERNAKLSSTDSGSLPPAAVLTRELPPVRATSGAISKGLVRFAQLRIA